MERGKGKKGKGKENPAILNLFVVDMLSGIPQCVGGCLVMVAKAEEDPRWIVRTGGEGRQEEKKGTKGFLSKLCFEIPRSSW